MHRPPSPPVTTGPPVVRKVLSIVGTLLAAVLVVGAGVGAWFGVERYVLEPGTATATSANGLPAERMDAALPWRSFHHTSERASGSIEAWVDLDAAEMRFVVVDGGGAPVEFERGADASYVEVPDGWAVVDGVEAVSRTANLGAVVGPFMLTDHLPPAAVEHVTVASDAEIDGVRVLELTIDKASFELADPLGYGRWLDRTDERADDPGARTLHVRPDGYVVGIDRVGSTSRWADLDSPVPLESPLVEASAGGLSPLVAD